MLQSNTKMEQKANPIILEMEGRKGEDIRNFRDGNGKSSTGRT